MTKEPPKPSLPFWAIMLPALMLLVGESLEQKIRGARLVVALLAAVIVFGWLAFYSVGVWRQAAQDKKEVEAKAARAMEQLRDSK